MSTHPVQPVLPEPADTGRLATRLHEAVTLDPSWPRLLDGCGRYNSDWTCTTGTIVIERFDLAADGRHLVGEALRAMTLKAAVHQLTGDLDLAELPIARPVDEVCHALLAQRQVTEDITARTGMAWVHATDTEQNTQPYESGSYTWAAYLEAFGAVPPLRYWIGGAEHDRRTTRLRELLAGVGLLDGGRLHELTFAA